MANLPNAKKSILEMIRYNSFLPYQNELSKIIRNFHGWIEFFNFTPERFKSLTITPFSNGIGGNDHFKIKVETLVTTEEDIKEGCVNSEWPGSSFFI